MTSRDERSRTALQAMLILIDAKINRLQQARAAIASLEEKPAASNEKRDNMDTQRRLRVIRRNT